MTVKYLTVEQVLKLHEQVVEYFGGSLGLRDLGLLESAVYRCQQTFGEEDLYPDLFSKAAALLESLCKNHPFVDGNKRIAFLATIVFLDINAIETEFEVNEAEEFMLSVASGQKSIDVIVLFLKKASTGSKWKG